MPLWQLQMRKVGVKVAWVKALHLGLGARSI